MDGEIAKTNCAFHAFSEFNVQRSVCGQRIERTAHRCRRSVASSGNAMQREINTKLNRTAQVERYDVLRIDIFCQRGSRGRATRFNACDASSQRLQLGCDYVCVHASRLSRNVRSMSGAKSA